MLRFFLGQPRSLLGECPIPTGNKVPSGNQFHTPTTSTSGYEESGFPHGSEERVPTLGAPAGRCSAMNNPTEQVRHALQPRRCTEEQRLDWISDVSDAVERTPSLQAVHQLTVTSMTHIINQSPRSTTCLQMLDPHSSAVQEHTIGNTEYYDLLYNALDLSGPFKQLDRAYIREHFHISAVHRDGRGLYAWAMHFGERKALNVKQRINLEREPMRHAMQQLQLHLETIELHDGAASPHRDSAASAEEHHVAQPGEHKQINKTDHRACYGEQVCQQLEAAELIAGASSGDSTPPDRLASTGEHNAYDAFTPHIGAPLTGEKKDIYHGPRTHNAILQWHECTGFDKQITPYNDTPLTGEDNASYDGYDAASTENHNPNKGAMFNKKPEDGRSISRMLRTG
jgi:hypothetical protein